MAVNLVDLVSNAITPDTVQSISRMLGERDSAVQSGIGALLPALIGGMAAKASTPSGASDLIGRINSSGLDDGLIGNLGSMLGSGDSSALLQQGSNLLGGLFGADKASGIADTLAGMTGMKSGSAASLLAMVVPIVLGVLKRFIGDKRLGPSEVAGMFAEQKNFLDGKLDQRLTSAMGLGSPTSLLSGLGNAASGAARGAAATMGRAGAAAGATASAATAAASGARRPWMPWALAAVVAAVLLTMLPRFGGDKGAPSMAQAPTAPAPATLAAKSESTTAASAETPATTAMGAAAASLPAKIYFETGKAELGADATAVVQSVAGMLATDPSAKVDLTGYTDKTGNAATNQELAKKRATAVKAALEAAGVAPDRVGMKAPMVTETGPGGSDAEARRVEIAAAK